MKTSSVNLDERAMGFQEYLDKIILGSADKCIEKINRYIDAGITYFILAFPGGETAANSADEFCDKVIKSIA